MIKASKNDRERVVDILSESFKDNGSVNAITGNNSQKIRYLMEYSFDKGLETGDIFLDEEKNAAVILLYPKSESTSLKSILRDIKLIFNVIGLANVPKVMKKEANVKKRHPEEAYAHLWYIGVDPNKWGHGHGSKLLRDVLEECKMKSLDVYLETSTVRNFNFYEREGFQRFDELDIGAKRPLMFYRYSNTT